jgi:tetratricopeptide (TPR) repeat protein
MKKTGDEYFDSDEFRDLLSEYEQAVNTGQPVFMDADELAEIADYYQMEGQADEAESAIRLALSLSPGAIAPLTYRIHEALYNGDVPLAKSYLSQIIETDEPDYIYNQAEILIAENRIEEADDYLRQEFRNVPPDEYQDYVVDVATIYSDYGISDKAMEWLSRSKPENTPDFKELMARTLFGLGKYKDSEKLFNELIDTDPYQKRYWNALASAQFMSEDYSSSVESSEYAIAIDPEDPEGLISKANGLYRLGNYEEALDYYRRYSEREPDDEFAIMHQGTCLINIGCVDEAIDTLRKALDTAPDDSPYLADIYQELAFAHSEAGDSDAAIAYLDKTDELECDHVQLLVVKGHILLSAGRIEEAEEQFRQAVLQSGNAPQTLLRIIVSLYDNKYIEASYNMFLKFFDIVEADYPEGYAYMALCCYDMKRHDEFLHYLKTACERNPRECRLVLGHLFPDDIAPENYYEYISNKIRQS